MRAILVALALLTTPALADDYSAKLEQTFLANGYSISVFPKDGALIVFGPMNNALVFNAIRKLNILQEAKSAGYRKVTFGDKITGGRWHYDISGSTLPRCDLAGRLCL